MFFCLWCCLQSSRLDPRHHGRLDGHLDDRHLDEFHRLAPGRHDENSDHDAEDYEAAASTLVQANATSARVVAILQKKEGRWQLESIVSATDAPEAGEVIETWGKVLSAAIAAS